METIKSFYFILWAIIALYMFVSAKKLGSLCYIIGGFFSFMTVWYAMNSFSGIAMFDGVLGIVFKCVVGAFLLGFALIYVIGKLKKNKK
jgi:membrane associated rhomboid family serine protease